MCARTEASQCGLHGCDPKHYMNVNTVEQTGQNLKRLKSLQKGKIIQQIKSNVL